STRGSARRSSRALRFGGQEAGLPLRHHPAAFVNLHRLEHAWLEIGILGQMRVERLPVGEVEDEKAAGHAAVPEQGTGIDDAGLSIGYELQMIGTALGACISV